MIQEFHRDISLEDHEYYEPFRGVLSNTGLIKVTYSDFSDLKKGQYITIIDLISFMSDREVSLTMSVAY